MINSLIPQRLKNFKHFLTAQYYHIRYSKPSKKLKVIGVTGTDGKTTTANLIHAILKQSNKKVGIISTLNAQIGDEKYPLDFHVTNPHPKDLQKFLKLMVDRGLDYAILETTSHGLDQHRVAGISYEYAVFTNVTHEHLDYHRTYENYLKTKSKLIHLTKEKGKVILNKDDGSFNYLFDLASNLERKVLSYGFTQNVDIKGDDLVKEDKYMKFSLKIGKEVYQLKTNLKGRYNISNIMAAVAVAQDLKIPAKDIKKTLVQVPQLEGRWEELQNKPFRVIVDFAHTPNSLDNALKRGELLKEKGGNLIVVFGCAGKRDYEKRPKMGNIAAEHADKIILTAEDPRGEDIEKINNETLEGIKSNVHGHKREYYSIHDRKEAIKKALEIAQKEDIIIITGKGHEKSMNLDGKNELPWDDKEITLELLKKQNDK